MNGLAQAIGSSAGNQSSTQTSVEVTKPANAFENIQQTNTRRNNPNAAAQERVDLYVNAASTNDSAGFISDLIGNMENSNLTEGQRLLLQSLVIAADGNERRGYNFAAKTIGNRLSGRMSNTGSATTR